MGLLDRHLAEIAERIVGHIDLEDVTSDILKKLTITNLELYFVVRQRPGADTYEFVGMAYSKSAAGLLWIEGSKEYPCKILELDLGKALTLAEKAGVVRVGQE